MEDLIKYDFLDPPSWRNQEEGIPSADEMIDQIIDFQESWNTLKTKIEADRLEDIQERFRKNYCDINTDPLKDESERGKKQQESSNVGKLLEFFDKEKEKSKDGLIKFKRSMFQEAHKIAVYGIKIKAGGTQPGVLSKNRRFTTYKGEEYEYPNPDYPDYVHIDTKFDRLLNRFNILINSTCKTDKRERFKEMFKSLAWFLFEILDLHPFGNGNGRLFRSFCYCVLSFHGLAMFPCSIYHVCEEGKNNDHSACCKPCKDCYEQVLVDARKSDKRRPRELATMLVESCWRTWGEFMEEIQQPAIP